ncbi:MAG: ATP-binding protein, partial [Oligoflexia bacterium]|nr:ATP-binding protein [Oligoflexia bacterium]
MIKIKPRERDSIIISLRAGVVPRIGLHHIQVGRLQEIKAIISDFEKIKNSGSNIRFIVGDFGSGKTFFLTLSKVLAHEKNIISTNVDITLEKTLYSRDGKAKATFSELIKNLSIKQKPDGGALKYIIEKWLSDFMDLESEQRKSKLKQKLSSLKDYVAGYDFIEVLNNYIEAYNEGNYDLLDSCMKWLRGEFKNITSVKQELPNIKTFINDNNYYDYLKLYSGFFRVLGYNGFLICLDELATLTRQKSDIRKKNYETILKIINDSLQGMNRGLMFVFGGTPDFVFCERKGLYSYGALKTRLAKNTFKNNKFKDYSGPLIELGKLTPEEYFQLLRNIREVFANRQNDNFLITDNDIQSFLKNMYNWLGSEEPYDYQ